MTQYKLTILMIALIIISGFGLGYKPIVVGRLNATVHITGVAQSEQQIYIPRVTPMQSVQMNVSYHTDDYGNRYVYVSGDFDIPIHVSINSRGSIVLNDEVLGAPQGQKYEEYLQDTSLINPSDDVIKSTSKMITKSDDTKLKAMVDLVSWIDTNIKYDDTFTTQFLSGAETLRVQRGVCDEFTNLYTSFARSLGIPSKIVVGLVYTGSVWQLHAWSESLVGGVWIPVDPTFGEIGQIDATHIVLYEGPSYPYYVSPNTKLHYNVADVEFGNYTLDITPTLDAPKQITPREAFNISLDISNNENFIVIPSYLLQLSVGFGLAGNSRKLCIVWPRSKCNLSWKVIAPYGERKDYYFSVSGPNLDVLKKVAILSGTPTKRPGVAITGVVVYSSKTSAKIDLNVENTGNVDLESVEVGAKDDIGETTKVINLRVGDSKKDSVILPLSKSTHMIDVFVKYGSVGKDEKIFINNIPRKSPKENLLNTYVKYLTRNSETLFVVMVVILTIVSLVLFLTIYPERGKPFKEQEKWHKLLRLKKRQ